VKRATAIVFVSLILASCSSTQPPPPPAPVPQPVAPSTSEVVIGTVRVTATALNVRKDPSTSAEILGLVKKGQKLALLANGDEWAKVRLEDGSVGWVTQQYVAREGQKRISSSQKPRGRSGCPPDSDYAFSTMPLPSFSESPKHGLVTVEANVTPGGDVTTARVIANTTGDDALGSQVVREIKSAKFIAPVRNCVAKPFIYTYKRSF
jgi:TonB family protein